MSYFATHIPAFGLKAVVRLGGIVLLLGLVFADAPVAAKVIPYAPERTSSYEMIDQGAYAGGQPSLMGEQSKARIEKGIAALRKSGMYDAIIAEYGSGSDGKPSDDAALMMAIAIRESTGALEAINQDSKAACTFQIIPDNIAVWYKTAGYASPAHMQKALMAIPSECLKYGAKAFTDQKGFATTEGYSGDRHLDRALCGYAGELPMFSKHGFCWASDEYKLTAARILGRTVEYVVVDQKSNKYARKIIKDTKTGRVLAEIFLCKDHAQEIPLALAKMANAYKVTRSQAEQDAYFDILKTNQEKKIRYHLPPQQTAGMCIDVLLEKNKRIQKLLKGDLDDLLNDLLDDVLDSLTATACQYAQTQIETALNNLLTAACVPLPNLSFSLGIDLPSLERTSCNGVSLADIYSVGSGSLSLGGGDDGLGASLPEGAFPPVDGLTSFSVGSPMPAPLLRRGRGGKTIGGVYEIY